MDRDTIYEKSINLPMGYVFTGRVRPSSVRRTAIRLLPWAIYAMLPMGRRSRIALAVAQRVSPLMRQKIRS